MALSREFSERDWGMAPRYQSPETTPGGVVALDFDRIRDIAIAEESMGSFRFSDDGTLAKTPVYVDHLPAALYIVNAEFPCFTPNHNTSDPETLVVIDGTLLVAPNDGSSREENTDAHSLIRQGEVAEFHDEAISMQVSNFVTPFEMDISPSRCLALALYRDDDLLIRVTDTHE